jgi:hypothetical protein
MWSPQTLRKSACIPGKPNNVLITITADSDYEPSGRSTITVHAFADPVCQYGSFSSAKPYGVFMVHRNNAGKLLLFPAPRPVSGSPAGNWSLRILETKDNLTSALEFLRIAYNEMLAGGR